MHADFCIMLDQSQYCRTVLNQFLEKVGTTHGNAHHYIPLHCDFVPSIKDCAKADEELQMIQEGNNTDFASCVEALIYLA